MQLYRGEHVFLFARAMTPRRDASRHARLSCSECRYAAPRHTYLSAEQPCLEAAALMPLFDTMAYC